METIQCQDKDCYTAAEEELGSLREFLILEFIARCALDSSGFFNFLIFGLNDPHLRRSFSVLLQHLGCGCCCNPSGEELSSNILKTSDVNKMVMFDGPIAESAENSRTLKQKHHYMKLSRADKVRLYEDRPDLDPRKKRLSQSKARSKSSVPISVPAPASPSTSQMAEHSDSVILRMGGDGGEGGSTADEGVSVLASVDRDTYAASVHVRSALYSDDGDAVVGEDEEGSAQSESKHPAGILVATHDSGDDRSAPFAHHSSSPAVSTAGGRGGWGAAGMGPSTSPLGPSPAGGGSSPSSLGGWITALGGFSEVERRKLEAEAEARVVAGMSVNDDDDASTSSDEEDEEDLELRSRF